MSSVLPFRSYLASPHSLPSFCTNPSRAVLGTAYVFKQVAWLAIQFPAQSFQRRKPYGSGSIILKYQKIGRRNANTLGQATNTHLSLGQRYINM
jgi:hypothetical protein